MLKTEWDFFRANLADWSKEYANQYVLIKDRELMGVFPTFHDAVVAGYERLGNTPFLIKLLDPSTEAMPGEAPLEKNHGIDHD